MRVAVTGMGGDFGARTAARLEADRSVEAVLGVDAYPPRRRLRRAEFVRIDPRDERRTAGALREFEPTVLVHLGVWEPDARAAPNVARARTQRGTRAALEGALAGGKLDHLVVRSGIEVYGRGPAVPRVPDESSPLHPTSPYGRSLARVEEEALAAGHRAGVPVTLLRFAPTIGSQFPSPLARLLRLPVVPVSAAGALVPTDFALLDVDDAAAAFAAAVQRRVHGPVNVVPEGSITPFAAVRTGNRLPWPVLGPGWIPTRAAARVIGAPIPAHLHELLIRGRLADGSSAGGLLGVTPGRTTSDVVRALFDWAPVVYLRPSEAAAA